MGGGGGKGSQPAQPAAPPPEPTPQPTPEAERQPTSPGARNTGRRRRGVNPTILTNPLGGSGAVSDDTLLG